ncbi:unnamed protein product [Rotaria sp. Silwood2]|nr:unnamed protein product [Rotaria sp. Silwood2]CAF2981389.1 unnamed protein product [Rotaria sp. Silwood2]CAF3294870.1 unnamed protein product [Rotaria sp. Silwood2]CAF3451290.1 unnamed protein product [Rotaria sp. Silwood2]CAF4359292.1 unnamed protein product [Rotaria sp. Silwood2]
MSDKFISHNLRDIDDTLNDREPYQQQTWTRTAIKAKENVELRQKFPPFVVPTAFYQIVHNVLKFTIDTESERSNHQLALIQIQTIPSRLPLLVILIELQHLPTNNLPTYVKIKEFFSLVFRSGNKLYSWDDMNKELEPIQDYHLFNWPTTALLIDIQLYFPDWYEWALAHCESCRLNHNRHYDGINYDDVPTQNYSSSKNVCHEQSPYRPVEKWSLQKALIYAAHMFIDKSSTVNNWAAGLTPNNSTLSYGRRKKMINYAIYDCFSTTYLIRPYLHHLNHYHYQQLIQQIKKIIKKNINLQKLFNFNDDDLQPVSDDDEIYLNQLIEPVTNEQPGNETISNDEQEFTGQNVVNDVELISDEDDEIIIDNNQEGQPAEENDNDEIPPAAVVEEKLPTTKRNRPHRQRSMASRQRRNRKRNNTHRKRRYQHYITRSMYYKFTKSSIRKILKQHHFNYVHVKVVDGIVIIGVKNALIQQQYQDQIPEDIFDRKHYQNYQHHHQHRYQHHHQHNHQHRHYHHHE